MNGEIELRALEFRLALQKEMEGLTKVIDSINVLYEQPLGLTPNWEGEGKNAWCSELNELLNEISKIANETFALVNQINELGGDLKEVMDKVEDMINSALLLVV